MSSPTPELSILIVNWNVRDLLDECLRSIKQFTAAGSFEVIVVDNASKDDSVEMVRRKYPWVKLTAATDNLGFTKGNNVALASAAGRFICYLNPDTELIEDVFTPLIKYMDEYPKIGAIAPKLLNTDRSIQNSIGRFTRLTSLLKEYFLRTKAEKQKLVYPTTPTVVDYAMGACLVVRGDLCRQLGGLDERFFMNHEETDLCYQLKKHGFPTIYYPLVAMIHHGSKSSTISVESRQRTLHENRKSQYLYFQKNSGWLTAETAKLIIVVAMASRILVLWLMNVFKKSDERSIKISYFSSTVSWLFQH